MPVNQNPAGHSKSRWRRLATTAGWLLPVVAAMLMLWPQESGAPEHSIPYSAFLQAVEAGNVAHVEIGETEIHGTFKARGPEGDSTFVTERVDPAIATELRAHGVTFSGATGSTVIEMVLAALPVLLVLAVYLLLRRGMGAQAAEATRFGKSRARVYAERNTRVTFDDVAGVDEAKAELKEIVEFLRDPKAFGELGARMPKGVLLVGPPGTGKTLLARAVAGQAGVPFFSINGSEFVELFVGVGAARVRDLFVRARQSAPCIVFIDEIDALGRSRGGSTVGGANDEKEQTLNQLLAELDGFDPESGVVLLAATNRPEILDPALLRAGRFDRQILVDRPDRAGRVQILRVHAKGIRVAPDVDLDQVAGLTPGFTGADLANLVNEAALTATRRAANAVTLQDFTIAVERIVAGLATHSRVLSPRERQITAYHEMGHALVALATPGADPVQKVSIIPHGLGALGYTLQRPAEDRYIATQDELEAKLTVMLGGRAAELLAFGELSTGAADDLGHATVLAREMVARYGMDATVGNVVYDEPGSPLLAPHRPGGLEGRYSEATAREIESAIRALLDGALKRATDILMLNRSALDEGAGHLQQRESLTRDELPPVIAASSPAGRSVGAPSVRPPLALVT